MASLYEVLAAHIRAAIPVAEVTVTAGPYALGAKMLVYLDREPGGALGLGELDARIAEDARALLRVEKAETRGYALPGDAAGEQVHVFVEPYSPPRELIIVGAGHTSIPLSEMARIAGFRVTLIDARAAFANRERFPHVEELIVGWPHQVLAERAITQATYVAVLTHDPKFEEPLLPVLLRSAARYLGVIGSRKTQLQRRERLRQEGFTEEDIRRLSGPIGLDLGAVTPEEIALSILAEMVARQHGRPGGSLTDTLPSPAR